MIAKDKARELVNKFVDKNIYEENPTDAVAIAKTSALICVDEIISIPSIQVAYAQGYNNSRSTESYWQKIKKEIKKL